MSRLPSGGALALPFLAALAALGLLPACGGAEATELVGPGSDDASAIPDGIAQTDSPVAPDAGPPPALCATDAAACGDPNVPSGWTPVAFASNTTAPCPAGFGTADDVSVDPQLGGSACSCSCTKTQDPDCQTGATVISGVGQTCGGFAASLAYTGGSCRPTSGTVDDYDKSTTIKPTGGACTVQAVPNNAAITTTPGRLCAADSTCAAAACGGYAPAGFTACIVSNGDVVCPAASAFSVKHLTTTNAQVTCSDCGAACTYQGDCTTPKLSFYSDNACNTLIVTIPADGTCAQTNHNNAVVGGTKYTATPTFSGCTATGSSVGTLDLQQPRTLCCRP